MKYLARSIFTLVVLFLQVSPAHAEDTDHTAYLEPIVSAAEAIAGFGIVVMGSGATAGGAGGLMLGDAGGRHLFADSVLVAKNGWTLSKASLDSSAFPYRVERSVDFQNRTLKESLLGVLSAALSSTVVSPPRRKKSYALATEKDARALFEELTFQLPPSSPGQWNITKVPYASPLPYVAQATSLDGKFSMRSFPTKSEADAYIENWNAKQAQAGQAH